MTKRSSSGSDDAGTQKRAPKLDYQAPGASPYDKPVDRYVRVANVMRQPCVDDFVRLLQDIPELGLIRNEVGVVRST